MRNRDTKVAGPGQRSRAAAFSSSGLAVTTGAAGAVAASGGAWGGNTLSDAFADFFQQHYQRMSEDEIAETIERIERKAKRRYGVDITCANTPPQRGCGVRLRDQHLEVSRLP